MFFPHDLPQVLRLGRLPRTYSHPGRRNGIKNKRQQSLLLGLFTGHVPQDRILEFMLYARTGGSTGVAFFSLEGIDRNHGYWEQLKTAIADFKNKDESR